MDAVAELVESDCGWKNGYLWPEFRFCMVSLPGSFTGVRNFTMQIKLLRDFFWLAFSRDLYIFWSIPDEFRGENRTN